MSQCFLMINKSIWDYGQFGCSKCTPWLSSPGDIRLVRDGANPAAWAPLPVKWKCNRRRHGKLVNYLCLATTASSMLAVVAVACGGCLPSSAVGLSMAPYFDYAGTAKALCYEQFLSLCKENLKSFQHQHLLRSSLISNRSVAPSRMLPFLHQSL